MAKQNDGVTYVSAEGRETVVTSPTEANNLVYGHGYKPKSGSIEDAYNSLVERASTPEEPAGPAEKPAPTVSKQAGS